ncbi:Protein of unknown function, partial [Gryllus bimaculatus]
MVRKDVRQARVLHMWSIGGSSVVSRFIGVCGFKCNNDVIYVTFVEKWELGIGDKITQKRDCQMHGACLKH